MIGDVCDGCFRPYNELDALSEAEDGGWYCGECIESMRWGPIHEPDVDPADIRPDFYR